MSTVNPAALPSRAPALPSHPSMSRRARRARSAGLLVAGVVGVSVSVPIAFSHIVKLGIDGPAIVGMIATIASIYAIVAATAGLVREATWPRRVLAVVTAFLLFQFVMFPLANAVYVTNAAHPLPGTRTPADFGLPFEDLTLFAGDGTELAAWYVPSHNGAAVVLRHGSGSTRSNTLRHAAFLVEEGYGVLMMDARGHGDSDGRINELGWYGNDDIAAAIDHLTTRHEITQGIGILGLSMGGEEALNYAATDDRVAAIVAEGVGTGTYGDAVADDPHAFERTVEWVQFGMTELLSGVAQPRGVAASMPAIAPRPVLLITGDEKIESSMGPVYAAAGGPTTTLWELPGTAHTSGLAEYPTGYENRVLQLFDNALLERR